MTVICTCHPGELNRHAVVDRQHTADVRVDDDHRLAARCLDPLDEVDAHAGEDTPALVVSKLKVEFPKPRAGAIPLHRNRHLRPGRPSPVIKSGDSQ